jgi:hypothetical protein
MITENLDIISQHEDIEGIFYRWSEYRSCQGMSGWTELPCSDELWKKHTIYTTNMSSQTGISHSLKKTRLLLWMKGIVVRMPAKQRILSSSRCSDWVHPALHSVVTGTLSLLAERLGRKADQNNARIYTSTSPYTFFEPHGQGVLISYYNTCTVVIAVIVNRIRRIQRCNNPYWAADSGPPVPEIPLLLMKVECFVRCSQLRNLVRSQLNIVYILRYHVCFVLIYS